MRRSVDHALGAAEALYERSSTATIRTDPMPDGLSIALSPVQLAPVLSGQDISESETRLFTPHVQ
jgi:hypothetical protein